MDPVNRHADARQLTRRTLALVLAGGRGSRLKDLTDRRAKPAVHLGGTFRMNDFVDLLPAQQRRNEEDWYRGTADAIWQNLDIIRNSPPPEYIVILAGDHIDKMDYSVMLADHVASGRGVTGVFIEGPRQ